MASRLLALLGACIVVVAALPQANVRRQVSELRESYDFIIVGGGTAGLTVADRLTEAFPNRTVLVVEYGTIQEAPGNYEPPNAPPPADRFNFASLPMPQLKNRTASVSAGRVVGGSSAVNGQFFDRGSRHDYDQWKAVGSPEFDQSKDVWDWSGILPWFKKSVTFTLPPEAEQLGYTHDVEAAYGGNGSIQSSFPPFQWPLTKVAWTAWIEAGLHSRKECAGGDKDGICWVPTSQDPITAKRSHAGVGHYQQVIEKRPNYDLLVKHKVIRVVYDKDGKGPPEVEIRSLADKTKKVAVARLEVVISAGALHTPQILQRSGIGHAEFLRLAGIDVVADVPGVGYNFQDHGGPSISVSLNKTLSPSQATINSNKTFAQEAIDLYALRPAKGPYTLAMGNSAIYVPLTNITPSYSEIVAKIRAQAAGSEAEAYLPPNTPPSVIAGYKAQLKILADGMENPQHPILESPFSGSPSGVAFHLKPTSRGTVMLNPANPDGDPIIDYRTATNPVDLDIMASFVPFFRHYFSTPTMQAYGAREVQPGEKVQTHEEIVNYLRGSIIPSFMHPCCTASMMPREKGGVVGTDLRVYGVERLRVVDLSVVPLIPGTHTSATTYAIAEKAADIMIRHWSS